MILVTGCTGFVGTHLVQALIENGDEVRCLARGTSGAERRLGPSIDFVIGDVTRPQTVLEAADGVDTIIHLVGIIREHGEVTYERVHVEGTRNLIEAAKSKGVRRFIYMSAIGARPNGATGYQTTKWQAEQLVRNSGLDWIIVRPSLIIGKDSDFVGTLKGLVTKAPIIPVIGSGDYRFQPLYVGDITNAFVTMVGSTKYWDQAYEFGGPERLTFNLMIETICDLLHVRKPIVHFPLSSMKLIVRIMDSTLRNPPITSDQLAMLSEDNITGHNAFTEAFGINPVIFRNALQKSL